MKFVTLQILSHPTSFSSSLSLVPMDHLDTSPTMQQSCMISTISEVTYVSSNRTLKKKEQFKPEIKKG